MKRVTNNLMRGGSVLGVAALLSIPSVSMALGSRDGATTTADTTKTSPFCTNLSTDISNINSRMTSLESKVSQAWTQQDQKLMAEAQTVDQKVAADRQAADTQRQADFTKLEAKATTGSEQQAVQTYETTVNNAVSTRRAAYDAARQTFRSGLAADVTSRHSTVTDQSDTFQVSVNAAISTAQASCASDPSGGAAARTAFVASLKSAREAFEGDRSGDQKVKQQAQQLAATRDATFRSADQAFKASMQTARQTLDKAFKSSSV